MICVYFSFLKRARLSLLIDPLDNNYHAPSNDYNVGIFSSQSLQHRARGKNVNIVH